MSEAIAVNLAQIEPFRIGPVEVHPSLREVGTGSDRETIEPRVMQVLIALAQFEGAVVSRDVLIQRCWDGRAISDDALNRVIAKVRRVASGPGHGAFHVETVAKVGYRLVRSEADLLESQPETAVNMAVGTPHYRGRGFLAAALIVGLAMAGTVLIFAKLRPAAPVPDVRQAHTAPAVSAASDLETRGLSAMFEGTPEQTREGIGYLRQATIIAPRRAEIWGSLAMGYVLSLAYTPENEQAAIVSRVREAARHAQSLDRHEGRSIAALSSLEPLFGNWVAQDQLLQRQLAAAPPRTAPLMFQRIQFLACVGKTGEALNLVNQLSAFSPLLPWIQAARAELLAADGRPDEAERVAAHAMEIWPHERLTWFTRFYLAAYSGKTELALAMAENRPGRPWQTDAREIALAVQTVKALASGSAADTDKLLAELRPLASRQQGYAEQGIRIASALGRPTDAMAFARQLYMTAVPAGPRGLLMPRIGLQGPSERNTTPLFLPPATTLWLQPDFMPLMKDIGLMDYWRQYGAPDFCRNPSSVNACRQAGLELRPRDVN